MENFVLEKWGVVLVFSSHRGSASGLVAKVEDGLLQMGELALAVLGVEVQQAPSSNQRFEIGVFVERFRSLNLGAFNTLSTIRQA